MSLMPAEALIEIAKALDFGARKYAPHGWRKGLSWSDNYDALQRHLLAWYRGEDSDPESKLSHLAHAGCRVLFLLTYQLTKTGNDDRWKPTMIGAFDPDRALQWFADMEKEEQMATKKATKKKPAKKAPAKKKATKKPSKKAMATKGE